VSGETNPWARSAIRQLLKFLDGKKPVPAPRRQKVTPVPPPRPPASPETGAPPASLGRLCITRIGPSRETPLRDYANMKATPNHGGLFTWDKDNRNKIQVGDVLGFILGSGNETYVEYFHIVKEDSVEHRDANWNSATPYSSNLQESVGHRSVIRMRALNNPKIRMWGELKAYLGYSPNCAKWIPRGTMVVRSIPSAGEVFY